MKIHDASRQMRTVPIELPHFGLTAVEMPWKLLVLAGYSEMREPCHVRCEKDFHSIVLWLYYFRLKRFPLAFVVCGGGGGGAATVAGAEVGVKCAA